MKKILLTAIISIFLTACSSSTKIAQPIQSSKTSSPTYYSSIEINNNGSGAPEHFLVAVKSYLKQELTNQALFSNNADNKITVTIANYRMRSGFNRAIFGVFAGKDGIDSTVVIRNSKTGEILGKSTVSSYNITAIGGMEDIAQMHAEEIAKFVSNKK